MVSDEIFKHVSVRFSLFQITGYSYDLRIKGHQLKLTPARVKLNKDFTYHENTVNYRSQETQTLTESKLQILKKKEIVNYITSDIVIEVFKFQLRQLLFKLFRSMK